MILKAKLLLKKVFLAASFSFCLVLSFLSMASNVSTQPTEDGDEWVSMPEGGKPAFVGVQGGTVPATVFYSEDRKGTITQVGLGNNDFLEAVHGSDESLVAANMIPFGFTDELVGTSNKLAANDSLPRVLPYGVSKIYEQDYDNDVLFVGRELTRM